MKVATNDKLRFLVLVFRRLLRDGEHVWTYEENECRENNKKKYVPIYKIDKDKRQMENIEMTWYKCSLSSRNRFRAEIKESQVFRRMKVREKQLELNHLKARKQSNSEKIT